MNPADQSLDQRLAAVAAELLLPGLPLVPDRVVPLALDLLAVDRDTPATVEVASLPRGSTMRDAEPSIRQMLAEQGIPLPESAVSDAEVYAVVLWAFAHGGMGVGEFAHRFYRLLPAWEEQSEEDRTLVQLLDEWEGTPDPADRAQVADRIRAAVSDA